MKRWGLLLFLGLQPLFVRAQDVVLSADSLSRRALGEFNLQEYEAAYQSWNLAIAQESRAEFFYYRGLCRYYQGGVDDAIRSLKTAVGIDREHFLSHRTLAELYWLKVDWERCLQEVNTALELRPSDPESLFILGRLYIANRRYLQGIETFSNYINLKPDDPEGYYMRAKGHIGAEQYTSALVDHDKALELRPAYLDALNDKALSLLYLQRYEEALASLDLALVEDAKSATAHFNRGVVLQRLGRTEEACEAWKKAQALGDTDAPEYLSAYCGED